MQVPRRREKVDDVWTEESWNQFLQELETGQKVRVSPVGLGVDAARDSCILESEFTPSDPSHP